jgi:hydroxymethylbilane synthase
VQEVYEELRVHHDVLFEPIWIQTAGDRDLTISLRTLDKTDFFTREIDALLLQGGCRIAIHSAKDLPEPLPEGLKLVALTRGVDPSDALVFVEPLLPNARIGASSARREAVVRALYPTCLCIDIRGTIQQRLALLEERVIDGLVVAEAALIRLGLKIHRIALPGPTAPMQGRLAVIAHADDIEMQELFACLCI